jgi:hypothetical protein
MQMYSLESCADARWCCWYMQMYSLESCADARSRCWNSHSILT